MHTSDASSMESRTQSEQLQRFLSALSNKDSLLVFELASRGAIASNTAFQMMKISRAKYHRKLRELVELGLILKDEEGAYRQTPIGEIIYQIHVVTLRRIAADTNLLRMMVKFNLKNKSSNKNFEGVVREITREVIARSDPGLWALSQLRLTETLEHYFASVINLVSNTKNELYLVARSVELPMIDALIAAVERSVKINFVYTDWGGFYSKSSVDPIDDLLNAASKNNPSAAKLSNSAPGISIKRVETHYGFVVSDNRHVMLEIADPQDSKSFIGGIGLENELVANRLIAYYAKLVQKPQLRQNSSRLS